MRAVGVSKALVLGASALVAAAAACAAAQPSVAPATAAAQPGLIADLSGTYWAAEYHPKLQPLGGGEPPLNDAGKAAYEQNRNGLRNRSLDDPTRTYCLPDGIPRLLSTPYPFQVYQLPPGQVTFVHELNNQVRVVPLDARLPSDEEILVNPVYEGYQTATYDSTGVLVIRAKGFNDQTFLDSSGLPHSDRLQTTERVRRIGNQLEDLLTIHDPEYYSRDWQVRFVYERRPGLRLQEYVCGEPHRDISGVKGVSEVRALRAKGQFP